MSGEFRIEDHRDEIMLLANELRDLIEFEFHSDEVSYYDTAINLIMAGYVKKDNATKGD